MKKSNPGSLDGIMCRISAMAECIAHQSHELQVATRLSSNTMNMEAFTSPRHEPVMVARTGAAAHPAPALPTMEPEVHYVADSVPHLHRARNSSVPRRGSGLLRSRGFTPIRTISDGGAPDGCGVGRGAAGPGGGRSLPRGAAPYPRRDHPNVLSCSATGTE